MRGEAVEDQGVGEVVVTQAGVMGRVEAGHRGHQAGQGGHGGRVTHGGPGDHSLHPIARPLRSDSLAPCSTTHFHRGDEVAWSHES